jgi:tetratricopeptide (TPR) repeat protein
MHHLIESGDAAQAAEYFGGNLADFERSAAVRALVNHIVAAEMKMHNFDLVYRLVAPEQPSDSRARIARRLTFDVMDTLAAVTRIDTQEQLIERCITALDDVIEKPSEGVSRIEAQHDLLEAWRKRRALRIAKNDLLGAMLAARRVIELAEVLREAEPANPEWVHDSMIAHADWGDTLDKLGDLAVARAAYVAALDCSDQLVNGYPESEPRKFARAGLASRAGAYLMKSGDLVAARCALEEALEALELLFDPGRVWPEVERSLAAVHRMLGELTRAEDESQWETTLEHYGTAIAFLSALRTDDPRNRAILHDVARIHGVRGDILRTQARSDDALSAYGEALNLLRVLASIDPDNSECQQDMDLCKLWITELDPERDPDCSA